MDLSARIEVRDATQRCRRGPRETPRLTAHFDGSGDLGKDLPTGPLELTIEATGEDMELASWLVDEWWTELIQVLADSQVTVHVAPTPGALLNPVVLYQLEMLRRVSPNWRLVGHAFTDDVATDAAVSDLVRSPYHEVRFADDPRPDAGPVDRRSWKPSIDKLFGQIRQQQTRLGRTTPILVRLPSTIRDTTSLPSTSTDKEDRAITRTTKAGEAAKPG